MNLFKSILIISVTYFLVLACTTESSAIKETPLLLESEIINIPKPLHHQGIIKYPNKKGAFSRFKGSARAKAELQAQENCGSEIVVIHEGLTKNKKWFELEYQCVKW